MTSTGFPQAVKMEKQVEWDNTWTDYVRVAHTVCHRSARTRAEKADSVAQSHVPLQIAASSFPFAWVA